MNTKLRNVAIGIIVINVIMFIFQQIFPQLTDMLLLNSSVIWSEPWRFITSMFLHADIWHLLFNMYALLVFGTLIEQRIGSKRFLWAYTISGLIAGLGASFFYDKALGASGAIMGILGLTIMLLPDLQVLFFFVVPMSMRTAGIIFAAFDLLGAITGSFGPIAHWAHLFGLACGLAYGYYLIRRKKAIHAKVLGTDNYNFKNKKKKSGNQKKKDTIELSDEDIEEYINNGRL